jgi:rSAM/selenodomain-associated transferase 1
MRRGLAILAKAPVAGQVKTRLAPTLGIQGAADMYRCFLLDTVELVMRLDGIEILLLYDPPEAAQALREMIGESFELAPQSGGDLGSRMNNGFRDLFARGCESAIIIGTDLPTLPLSHLTAAFSILDRKATVLGPSLDGGYYLFGLRELQPQLFEGIAWSTNRVLGQTVDRINRLGLAVECLEPWYDVDTVEDLGFLTSHLRLLMACGQSGLPRHTVDLLRRLGRLP